MPWHLILCKFLRRSFQISRMGVLTCLLGSPWGYMTELYVRSRSLTLQQVWTDFEQDSSVLGSLKGFEFSHTHALVLGEEKHCVLCSWFFSCHRDAFRNKPFFPLRGTGNFSWFADVRTTWWPDLGCCELDCFRTFYLLILVLSLILSQTTCWNWRRVLSSQGACLEKTEGQDQKPEWF